MNAEQLELSADLLLKNVKGWEQRAIAVICERIKTLGYISPTDQKALKNIVDFTGDMDSITKDLATALAMTSKDIEILYKQTLEYTGNQKESLYQYLSISPTPFIDNKKAQAIVRAFMKTTEKSMRNLSMTKALYLTGADGVRKPFEEAYQSILDRAVLAVTTGAGDFQSEMRSTIAQLGGGGVRVNYGGGVTRRLDSVVRQNILYGAKQSSIEYDEVIGEELGCDGFEVDYHSSPRPSHGFMGGEMFAIGKARTIKGVYYPSGAVALERLNDYGCLHDKSTVILGVSEPSFTKEELAEFKAKDEELVDIDGVKKTRYQWKQEQRKLETAVRYKKDQANAFKASGDMDGRRQAQGSIDSLTAKYDRLTEKAGLQSTPERMNVAGFNKVKANVNKPLNNGNISGIITVNKDNQVTQYRKFDINNQSEYTEWENAYYKKSSPNLTDADKEYIKIYSDGSFEAINGVERFAPNSAEYNSICNKYRVENLDEYKKQSDKISQAISKFESDEDIITHRYVRGVDYITGIDSTADSIVGSIGKQYTEKGFTSSCIFDKLAKHFGGQNPIHIEIKVPKNSKGAYINEFSEKKNTEFEFLLDKNTQFKITDGGERTIQVKKFDYKERKWMSVEDKEKYLTLEVVK